MGAGHSPGEAPEESSGAPSSSSDPVRPSPEGSAGWIPKAFLAGGCLVICSVALSLYLANQGHGFVFDDHNAVEQNLRIRSLGSWPELFTTPWWGEKRNNGLYRPVTLLSFALNFNSYRLVPGAYHYWNDLLHALNSALVFLLAWSSFRSRSAALIAGLLFAIHPIHGEAVHWISARADLLSAFFTMLALLAVLSFGAGHRRPGLAVPALAALCCLLAILSKENGVVAFAVVPLALLLLRNPDEPYAERKGLAELARGLWSGPLRVVSILLVGAGLVWLVLRQNAIGSDTLPIPPGDNPLAYASVVERVSTALSVVPLALGKLVLPTSLSVDYGPPRIPVVGFPGTWQTWLGMALLVALVVALWRLRDRMPAVAFWIGFLLLAYLPTSNLLLPVGMVFSERWLYMPSIASCILIGFGLGRIPVPWLGWGAAALLGIAYWGTSVARIPAWQSDATLFEHEMKLRPPSARAQRNYAVLIQKGDPMGAEALFRDLVARFPDDATTRYAYGTFLLGRNEPAAALRQLEEADRLRPDDALTLLNLGAAYGHVKQWGKAADAWERALQVEPDNQMARENLEALRGRGAGRGLRQAPF